MRRDFKSVEELNEFYAVKLHNLAEVSDNVNNDVLIKMIASLMKDYDLNYDLLNSDDRFEKSIFKKRRAMERKHQKLEFDFEMKKQRHLWWEKWKNNRKLFKLYKEQCKVVLAKGVEVEEIKLEEMKVLDPRTLLEQQNKSPVCERLMPSHIDNEVVVEEETIFEEPDIEIHENENFEDET